MTAMAAAGTGNNGRIASVMPPLLPPRRMRDAVDRNVGVALRLAGIIHMSDPVEAAKLVAGISAEDMTVVACLLAAMVDIDKTPGELFAWVPGYRAPDRLRRVTAVAPPSILLDQPRKRAHDAECGTHNGYLAHLRHGETPDPECEIAEQAWQRTRPPVKCRKCKRPLRSTRSAAAGVGERCKAKTAVKPAPKPEPAALFTIEDLDAA